MADGKERPGGTHSIQVSSRQLRGQVLDSLLREDDDVDEVVQFDAVDGAGDAHVAWVEGGRSSDDDFRVDNVAAEVGATGILPLDKDLKRRRR